MSGRFIDWEKHIHLASVDSTNNYIRRPEVAAGSWVTADEQTRGRGRGQHSWTAIGGERLIFSAKVELPTAPTPALPVRIGGAVLRACRTAVSAEPGALRLKWPNDIFRHDKKIAGILIEAESGQTHTLILGIGVNISGAALPPQLPDAGYLLDTPAADSAGNLVREVIAEINGVLSDAANSEASRAELDWVQKNSYLGGKKIQAKSGEKTVEGVVRGISDEGYLRVTTQAGDELLLTDAASEIRTVAG